MWSVLSEEQKKRLLIIGGIGVVLVLGAAVFFFATRPSEPTGPRPELELVRQYELNKDVAALEKAAVNPDPNQAAAAIGALTRVAPEQARPIVQRALADRNFQVRAVAASWYPRVADLGNPAEIAPIQKMVAEDKSNEVIIAALKALGEMKAWDSLEQVFAKMNDSDRSIRAAAAAAAAEIMFIRVDTNYSPDDPPDKRLKAIAGFRAFARYPGRRERYLEWLSEMKAKPSVRK